MFRVESLLGEMGVSADPAMHTYKNPYIPMPNCPYLDVTVNLTDASPGIQSILKVVRPNWQWDQVCHERLHGLSNYIWKLSLGADAEEDAVLVRVYDPKKTYLRHALRFELVSALATRGIIAPVYCQFANGYSYKYMPGECIRVTEVMNPDIYPTILAKFHEFHSVPLAQLPNLIYPWRDNLPQFIAFFNSPLTEKFDSMERYCAEFPSRADLVDELNWACENVYRGLESDFPMVLCHNDAHCGNIIYNKQHGSTSFIDFDLVGIMPEVFDVAVHLERDPEFFFEDAGVDPLSNVAFKEAWLESYLGSHPVYGQQAVSRQLLDKWVDGLHRAAYMSSSCLLLFGLLQIVVQPPIDHDFWKSSIRLHRMQRKCKALFTAEPVRGCAPWDS